MKDLSYIREHHNDKTFQEELDIRGKGYKKLFKSYDYDLIAFTQMVFEHTFIFETQEEADRGFKRFEQENDFDVSDKAVPDEDDDCLFVGWWYGREEFKKTLEDYEKDHGEFFGKPHVVWLDKKPLDI